MSVYGLRTSLTERIHDPIFAVFDPGLSTTIPSTISMPAHYGSQ